MSEQATPLVEVETKGIQRYNIGAKYDENDPTRPFSFAALHDEGEWVRYADYLAVTNREAPMNSVERLADEAIAGLAEFFGKVINDESFCGMSVQIKLDQFGKPAVFEVAACEIIGNEPLRRVPVSKV